MIKILGHILSGALLFSALACASAAFSAGPPSGNKYELETDDPLMAACRTGNRNACFNFSSSVVSQKKSVELGAREYWLVKEAYEKSCNQGLANACHNLAFEYRQNGALGYNPYLQVDWYGKGCALGDREDCKLAQELQTWIDDHTEESTPQYRGPCGDDLDMGLDLSGNQLCRPRG